MKWSKKIYHLAFLQLRERAEIMHIETKPKGQVLDNIIHKCHPLKKKLIQSNNSIPLYFRMKQNKEKLRFNLKRTYFVIILQKISLQMILLHRIG